MSRYVLGILTMCLISSQLGYILFEVGGIFLNYSSWLLEYNATLVLILVYVFLAGSSMYFVLKTMKHGYKVGYSGEQNLEDSLLVDEGMPSEGVSRVWVVFYFIFFAVALGWSIMILLIDTGNIEMLFTWPFGYLLFGHFFMALFMIFYFLRSKETVE